MAKKVSKHSRAARRNEVEDIEAKSLSSLPRASTTDLTNVLLRTASKNEALLEAKIKNKRGKNKDRVSKKTTKVPTTSLDSVRLERALKFASRLDGKIEKSVSRAKYVQSARKSGWDATNAMIKEDLSNKGKITPPVKDLTKDLSKDLNKDEDEIEIEVEDKDTETKLVEATNIFGTLADDVEA
ncbi:HDL169Cp [Eremothecium sinecaudum]|uniref:HDL169Cp n=1 Tax=Eremothecium sinecaudum TaxID=45286 RepID=A0A0X8HSB8_9SACH|nr:HDL169Cp [Eremothecium sinecaudum]AMD20575.1 HDL169Cp [Eremothecium sinecaudum]